MEYNPPCRVGLLPIVNEFFLPTSRRRVARSIRGEGMGSRGEESILIERRVCALKLRHSNMFGVENIYDAS